MDDRIKIAEWMGWKQDPHIPRVDDGRCYWLRPDGKRVWWNFLPDPLTDANDCEAVIRKLQSLGWYVEIEFQTYPEPLRSTHVEGMGVFLHIWHIESEVHHRFDTSVDNWKQGVCELALKVIDNDR